MAQTSMFKDTAELAYYIALIEENFSTMNTVACGILRGEYASHADDAVQNACISIAKNIFTIKTRLARHKKRAFCVRVVQNKCIDIIRINAKQSPQALNEIEHDAEPIAPDPLDEVLASEGFETLIHVIDSLGERYADVLKYKLIDRLSDTEIAEKVGITPKNVNVRVFRGKRELRRRVGVR